MLSSRLAQTSRVVASSSAGPLRNLHATSAALAAEAQHRPKPAQRRGQLQGLAKGLERLVNPHVVLGHRPGDEAKWLNCDLAKALVSEQEIRSMPPLPEIPPRANAKVVLPKYFNFGIGEAEKAVLFEALPALTVEGIVQFAGTTQRSLKPEFIYSASEKAEIVETYKANMLARALDLRNANAAGIAFENRRRCITAFSKSDKPNDTGRPEVQAALLTMQIRHLWEHLTNNVRDVSSRRSLRKLVHKRAKILKYLKRLDQDRYDQVLDRLGLEPESVEGELNV